VGPREVKIQDESTNYLNKKSGGGLLGEKVGGACEGSMKNYGKKSERGRTVEGKINWNQKKKHGRGCWVRGGDEDRKGGPERE